MRPPPAPRKVRRIDRAEAEENRRAFHKVLILGIIVVGLMLGPFAAAMSYLIYSAMAPTVAAEFHVAEVDTDVAVKFYQVRVDAPDKNWLSLTVRKGDETVTPALCEFDQVQRERTNVYLTAELDVAVLGPGQCHYRITFDPLTVKRSWRPPALRWTYLGAFDFLVTPRERVFRFVSAKEQPECPALRHPATDQNTPDQQREPCPEFVAVRTPPIPVPR